MSNIDEKLINYGNLSTFHNDIINDSSLSDKATWSSSKINEEILAVAGTANSEIEGKETEDFTFVTELPASGEEDEQVIIKGENADTLYKYVSGSWVEQTPDATKLYFDTENEALYSYVSADHQFAPVSLVNTIIVGSNLNTNTALKAIKTPGVYSVVQRLHSSTKGDYIKNWTLTVEGIDYDEYERTDSIYQRMQSNYTIYKRTWSSTRATNDGWSNFSTYYAGEIKDSTTSKYYTWSSNKLSDMFNNIPQLEAGQNVEIVDNTISTIGYAAGKSATSSFVELPEIVIEPYTDVTSQMPSTDLYFTGDAGATTYTVSGQLVAIIGSMVGVVAFQVGSGNIALLTAYDSTNSTVTLDKTLDADNALSTAQMSKIYMAALVYFSGAAGATTYNIVDSAGATTIFADAQKIKISDYPIATIVSVDSTNNTITLSETLDASNAVSNAQFMYAIQVNNTASGMCSHAEGANTTASGLHSHAEGHNTTASGIGSHAEGQNNTASGNNSHAEGNQTVASGAYSHAEGLSSDALSNGSHAEGNHTTANNYAEHAEGQYNVSHTTGTPSDRDAGNTQHSVGVGNYNTHMNAFEIMKNGDVYVYGIGGYVGTNTTVQDATIKTLQAYIASLEARIAALEGNTTAE